MPIPMLDAVDFTKIPSLNFVVPVVAADPPAYEAGLIYNSTTKELKYHTGVQWVTLGVTGAGAPPTGAAGGDLSGSYPNPQIAPGVITDADISGSAAIATSKIAGLDAALAGAASSATTLTAGAGLTGGGTLGAPSTFDVGAGTGIVVAADTVSVDTTVIATSTAVDAAIAAHAAAPDPHAGYQLESEKGVANGYAPLDASGLIPTAHVPPLAVNEVFTVATEAEMLALAAQRGDMAIRTDNGLTYVLSTDDPTVAANWKEVTAAGSVVSVNGQTGVVSITLASLGGVPTTTSVIAGAGLTGGGPLAADVTLNVAGDATLAVGADSLSVVSAPKWTTARTVQLTGDVTGSALIDGSGDVSIPTTVINAGKRYAGNVAAGTTVPVVHNLGTLDVQVQVYEIATGATVFCGVNRVDVNTVSLVFASGVAADVYRVVVLA